MIFDDRPRPLPGFRVRPGDELAGFNLNQINPAIDLDWPNSVPPWRLTPMLAQAPVWPPLGLVVSDSGSPQPPASADRLPGFRVEPQHDIAGFGLFTDTGRENWSATLADAVRQMASGYPGQPSSPHRRGMEDRVRQVALEAPPPVPFRLARVPSPRHLTMHSNPLFDFHEPAIASRLSGRARVDGLPWRASRASYPANSPVGPMRETALAVNSPSTWPPLIQTGGERPRVEGAVATEPNGSYLRNNSRARSLADTDGTKTLPVQPSKLPLPPEAPIEPGETGQRVPLSFLEDRAPVIPLAGDFTTAIARFANRVYQDSILKAGDDVVRLVERYVDDPIRTTFSVLNSFPQTRVEGEFLAGFSAVVTILANAARGLAFERAVIDALNAARRAKRFHKNTSKIHVDGLGRSIPDILLDGITEIKSGVEIDITPQLLIQTGYAKDAGMPYSLIVGPNTKRISAEVRERVAATRGTIERFDPATGTFTPVR